MLILRLIRSFLKPIIVVLMVIIILLSFHQTNFQLIYRHFPELKFKSLLRDNIVKYIRDNHITPPSSPDIPYNFSTGYDSFPEHDKLHTELIKIVNQHCPTPGIFIEAGALDGQYLSHTLDLERDWNWTGLLVEASPSKVKQLKSKNRRSWIADVCLRDQLNSTLDFITIKVQDVSWKGGNGMINPESLTIKPKYMAKAQEYISEGKVECFSLDSILEAVKITRVDLFVLDVEGHEFQVLKNFPFQKIPITVIAVEHWVMSDEQRLKLVNLMKENGYNLVYKSDSDYIFVHSKN